MYYYAYAHFTSKETMAKRSHLLRAKKDSELDRPETTLLTTLLLVHKALFFFFSLNSVPFSHGQNMLGQASLL